MQTLINLIARYYNLLRLPGVGIVLEVGLVIRLPPAGPVKMLALILLGVLLFHWYRLNKGPQQLGVERYYRNEGAFIGADIFLTLIIILGYLL